MSLIFRSVHLAFAELPFQQHTETREDVQEVNDGRCCDGNWDSHRVLRADAAVIGVRFALARPRVEGWLGGAPRRGRRDAIPNVTEVRNECIDEFAYFRSYQNITFPTCARVRSTLSPCRRDSEAGRAADKEITWERATQ